MFSPKFNIYIVFSPKVQGSLKKRELEKCKNYRQWMTTKIQSLGDYSAIVHINSQWL